MNKGLFVIFIAIFASTLSIVIQMFTRGREMSPALKRVTTGLFVAGVIMFILMVTIILQR
jgi:hypothetical protein